MGARLTLCNSELHMTQGAIACFQARHRSINPLWNLLLCTALYMLPQLVSASYTLLRGCQHGGQARDKPVS